METKQYRPQRRSIRLKDYDYSQPGSYFVTICTFGQINLFGDIEENGQESASEEAINSIDSKRGEDFKTFKMNLNSFGNAVLYTWNDLPNHIHGIHLGEFVVMPNHVHGIVHILDPETEWEDFIPSEFRFVDNELELNKKGMQTPLSEIVRQFKTFSTMRINKLRQTPGESVWKRDYYEHIIRNQEAYDQIVEYIQNNPLMWKMDRLNLK